MLDDFRNLKEEGTYVVEHYQEIPSQYELTENGIVQTNLTIDKNGNPVLSYSLFEKETFFGTPDSMTEAMAKFYDDFQHSHLVRKNLSDNSTVVKIFYNRKVVTVTVSIGDGIWNYKQMKTDPSVA